MNSVIRYFDLFSRRRSATAQAYGQAAGGGGGDNVPPFYWQVLLYVALLGGVVTKTVLEHYTKKPPEPFNWIRLAVAVVTAIIAYPATYKQAMEQAGPGFVQLCVVFAAGFGLKAAIDISAASSGA